MLAGVHEQHLEIGEVMKIDATVTVHVGEAAAGAVVGTGAAAGEAVVEKVVIALVDKPVAVEVAVAVFGDVAPAKIIPRRGALAVYGSYVHFHAWRRGRVGSFRKPAVDDLIALGKLSLETERNDQALIWFREALEREPYNKQGLEGLAQAAKALEQSDLLLQCQKHLELLENPCHK